MPPFTINQFQCDCGHQKEVKVSPFFLNIPGRNGEVDSQDRISDFRAKIRKSQSGPH